MTNPSSPASQKVIVIGAGLAGLSCAVRLHETGNSVEIFEASDGIGGRVRTDVVDGFLLDRGFQVYLDAYPEAGKFLDLDALDLHPFEPGALVWKNCKLHSVMDVFRRPRNLLSSAFAPIGSFGDKIHVARLRHALLRKSIPDIWESPNQSTADYLRNFGFSDQMIDEFFRSFYGGIFLENMLVTSSRIFEFTFQMFSKGSATLPAKGMQAIPEQLAARLPEHCIHLNCPVKEIEGTTVKLSDAILDADAVVVATDGSSASRLLPSLKSPKWNSTSCLYFAADDSPISQPMIALKGDREGVINNVCVPSQIAPTYAPDGKSLISVSVLGDHTEENQLTRIVCEELIEWFGESARGWNHLRTEHIRKALPIDPPGHAASDPQSGPICVCGDHTKSGSIEGAILSGLQTAEEILTKAKPA